MFGQSIRTKLLFAFGGMIALMLAQSGIGMLSLDAVRKAAGSIERKWLPNTGTLSELDVALNGLRVLQAMHLLESGNAGMDAIEQRMEETVGRIAAVRDRFVADDEERELLDEFARQWTEMQSAHRLMLGYSRKLQKEEANVIFDGAGRKAMERTSAVVGRLRSANLDGGIEASRVVERVFDQTRLTMALAIALGVALAGALAVLMDRRIALPIRQTVAVMRRLMNGDLTATVTTRRKGSGIGGEIGAMTGAVDAFRTSLAEAAQLREARAEQERQAAMDRRDALLALARRFEEQVERVVDSVADASAELESTAREMGGTVDRAIDRTAAVSQEAANSSATVQSVAIAAEELATSISEIGGHVALAVRTTEAMVVRGRRTAETVAQLDQAVQKIGEVVGLIHSVAGQTNLLALNATIEAARAGEAGRGFAVVAGEVKQLAGQASAATNVIGEQIGLIQATTNEASKAIREILDSIAQVSEGSNAVAAAVEQQRAATAEIARSIELVAAGTRQVAGNVEEAGTAARRIGSASGTVLDGARQLSASTVSLKKFVGDFLGSVRA